MEKDQIVIFTQMDDPHTDDVILALERMGHEAIRLNTDEIPADVEFSFRWGGDIDGSFGGAVEVLTNGRVVDAASVRSVWWRRPGAYSFPEGLSLQEREFAKGEVDQALRSMWSSLDCFWVSHPDRILEASWKGGQLRQARRLGFEVPRTLVTTSPGEARAFFDACGGRMAFKVMSDPFLGVDAASEKAPDGEVELLETRTTLVTQSDLDLLDSVRTVPCLFQEYVPKRHELRVTVIGDAVFAAEIHSQEREETSVDWRNYDVDVPYVATTLPAEVADRCLALVRNYGLAYSAMDLIVTPDGQYVFVESNPNGQFIFVEEKLPQLAMTDAMAACLVRGASS